MVNFGRPGDLPRIPLLLPPREVNGGTLGVRPPLVVPVFAFDPPKTPLDARVEASVDQRVKKIVDDWAKANPKTDVDKVEEALRKAATAGALSKVTSLLNKKPLDEGTRILLGRKEIYLKVLTEAGAALGNKFDDTEGVADGVLRRIGELRTELVRDLVRDVLTARDIDLQKNKDAIDATVARLESTLSFAPGKVEPAVWETFEAAINTGNVPDKVQRYLDKEGVPKQPSAVIRLMSEYLLRHARIETKKLDIQKHQEFFALAFEYARRRARGEDDPIDAVRTKGATSEWDYQVELFEAADEQPVVAENILVAGALDYLSTLGEGMGVFKIADAVLLEWGAGLLDVTGETADRLYRYYKLRDERSSEEERGMLYRRVLGRGDAEVLSDAVVNEAFAGLWHKLMTEVARYVRKVERVEVEKVRVSASALYQAARDLQYNLTEFGTGLAHKQAFEIYKHFEEAMELLGDPQVVEHYTSGRRKNVWAVIERIAKAKFGTPVNISALKTLAVEGNKIFRWLAEFRFAQPSASNLQALLDASEAWIIAQAEAEGQGPPEPEGEEGLEEEEGAPRDDVDEDWDA